MLASGGFKGKIVEGEMDKFNSNVINIKHHGINESQTKTIKFRLLFSLINDYENYGKLAVVKNTSIIQEFCWILFCSSVSIFYITWSNIAQSLES